MESTTHTARQIGSLLLPAVVASGMIAAASSAAASSVRAVDDGQVTRAVADTLIGDHGVSTDPIDVSAAHGVVTLSGTIHDVRTDGRAVADARAVEGVRCVVDMLEIEPSFRTDEDLQKDVENALSRSPATSDLPIRALAKGGRVLLNGVVQSRQQKRMAAETVGGVRGVAAIDNWLRVDDTAPRPDEAIEKDVESALQSDIRVDDTLLDVSVDGGRVTLEGSVGSGAELTRARTDALSQRGVVAVDDTGVEIAWVTENDLIRHAGAQPTDGEIRTAVADALASDPRVDSRRIEVTVEGGEATLTGVVGNLWTRRVAARDATDTVGVLHVHDFLKVRPATRLSDENLSSRVQGALKSDADLSRYDIRANVLEGTAVLEGRVPTAFDSDLAERVVASIDGVTAVDDVLLVTGVEQQKPDLVVEDDIRSQFWWSPYVDADAVNVSVRDGVATLTGMVATRRERMAAASNAREGGARRVRNEIRLRAVR